MQFLHDDDGGHSLYRQRIEAFVRRGVGRRFINATILQHGPNIISPVDDLWKNG